MAENSWDRLAGQNVVAGFVDTCLRGAAQVFFQNNALSGFVILAGVFWGGYAGGHPMVAWGATLGVAVATAMAHLLGAENGALRQGLFGFNGVLVGAALPTFLASHPALWAYVIVGAAVSTVVTLAIANVVKTWLVPGSTAPFVLTAWLLLLAAYSFANVPIAAMGPPALPSPTSAPTSANFAAIATLGTLARNVSQVYLVDNIVTGLLFVVAIALSSWRCALFAVLGSVVSVIVAAGFGARPGAIDAGLFGFSAVLTTMAVGAVFNKPSFRVTVYAILAAVFTVIVQAALDTAMAPLGIPTLTFPYVLTMWLFLLPKADLVPLPHHLAVPNGVLAKD
jgi:urea transporter